MKFIKKVIKQFIPESLFFLLIDVVKTKKECFLQAKNMEFFDSLNIYENTKNFECVICKSKTCINIKYNYEFDSSITKHKCLTCGHLQPAYDFHFLESNSYDFKPYFPEGELKLIKMALQYTKNGNVLVLGGGGNFEYMKNNTPLNVKYSDIIDRKDDRYIRVDDLSNFVGLFDAIVSRAVVEHFDNPIDTFRQLNKLLKTEGIMIHSFPNIIDHDLNHIMVGIRSHTNIFSKKSLAICLDESGFIKDDKFKKFIGIGYGHPTYLFRKVKNVD